MTSYIGVPVVTDPDAITAAALDRLTTLLPGFVPREGHLDVILIEVLARLVAMARDVAAQVPTTIFRYYGQNLIGLDPIVPFAAAVATTWTAIDAAGYTIPQGAVAAFRTAGDVIVPFKVRDAVTIAPGSTTTTAGEVVMDALGAGLGGNGLTGVMTLVDSLAFVDTVTAVTTSSGGVDAETDEEYLSRLVAELQLLSPRPILPPDFAVLARRVPGVARAVAIDGYNPNDLTSGNERMITVVVVDEFGEALSGGVKTAVDDLLEDAREINFVVWVDDPTYTTVDVDFAVTKVATADAAATQARIIAALTNYLDPGVWGGGNQTPPAWENETVVRYLEVASLINNVTGVDYITALTLNGSAADVNLTGIAPLTRPGAISGTVT